MHGSLVFRYLRSRRIRGTISQKETEIETKMANIHIGFYFLFLHDNFALKLPYYNIGFHFNTLDITYNVIQDITHTDIKANFINRD